MSLNLPLYISVIFILTSLIALSLFYFAMYNADSSNSSSNAKIVISFVSFWLVIQAILTLNDFYIFDTTGIPPRFAIAIVPPFLTVLVVFLTKRGKVFIDTMHLADITYLNIIRIPVEIVLYLLFLHHAVPKLMTFEGKNFDILAGVSAPFIAYWGFEKGKLSNKTILAWNILAFLLLINVLLIGIFSAPFDFQLFSYKQPNLAILHFPFVWLPSFIVPLVFFGHIVSIRQLVLSFKQSNMVKEAEI
jgi:hypothetical protein